MFTNLTALMPATLTQQQKRLVRDSFALVQPIAAPAARLFYGRLFEMAPQTRSLFHHDIEDQGKKLMQTLAVAVAHLDRLDDIVPSLAALGHRHATYGIEPQHYDIVGGVLLWTLEQGLGNRFTPDHRDAWAAVYTLLAATMQHAKATD